MARIDLSRLRKDLEITQKDMAKQLGVSQGFLSSVEKGRNPIPAERLDMLTKIYPDVNLDEYYIDEQVPITVNSNNDASPILINEKDVINKLLEAAKGGETCGHGSGAKEHMLYDRLQKMIEDNDKLRDRIDEYQSQINALGNEILRLKTLLVENGIKF